MLGFELGAFCACAVGAANPSSNAPMVRTKAASAARGFMGFCIEWPLSSLLKQL